MGLLSYLAARKSNGRSSRSSSVLGGHSYDTTAASLPPVQGTYPMAGNGPVNTLETLQKSQQQREYPGNASDGPSEISAPAPAVPRLRDLQLSSGIERPSTAPGKEEEAPSYTTSRPRRMTLKKSAIPSMSLHSNDASSARSQPRSELPAGGSLGPRPAERRDFQSPVKPFAHADTRCNSIQSIGSGRGFVDLLDASAELRPSNFHSRLEAAGAKIYGEDVADRNRRNTEQAAHQARAYSALTNTVINDRSPTTMQEQAAVVRHDSLDLAIHKPRDSLMNNPLGMHPSSAAPSEPPTHEETFQDQTIRLSRHLSQRSSDKKNRRLSLGSYVPKSSSTGFPANPTQAEQERARRQRLRQTAGPALFSQYLVPDMLPEPVPSPRIARDSVLLARTNYSLPSNSSTPNTPYRGKAKSNHGSRGTSIASQHSNKSRYTHSKDGSYSSTIHEATPPLPQAQPRKKPRRQSLRIDVQPHHRSRDIEIERPAQRATYAETVIGNEYDSPASPPQVRRYGGGLTRNDGWEYPYSRTKSLGSSSYYRPQRLDEIFEHIPVRTSSLAKWSVSSHTPTASSTSSAQFARPQSRHTPDTSIDMTSGTTSWAKPESTPSENGRPRGRSRTGVYEDSSRRYYIDDYADDDDDEEEDEEGEGDDSVIIFRPSQVRDLQREKSWQHMDLASPTFEATATADGDMDDYLSSDDEDDADSLGGPIRSRGEGEGELLFQENGYGGLRLPGLFDTPLSAPSPPNGEKSKESSVSYDLYGNIACIPTSAVRPTHSPVRRGRRSRAQSSVQSIPEHDRYQHQHQHQYQQHDDDDVTTLAPSTYTHDWYYAHDPEDFDLGPTDELPSPRHYHYHEQQRADLAPGRKGMKRISALGIRGPGPVISPQQSALPLNAPAAVPVETPAALEQGQVLERVKQDKKAMDVRAAVKLRKEDKAKKRAGGQNARSRTKSKGKAPEVEAEGEATA